ncbi:MAG: metal ABC transporter permease [Bacilli bacterium]|nr:metal ABC transporter permease [Bacilli bacterium]MBQ6282595.1 metal ABC transporter permease [Bacilli bacterium]
MSNIIEMFSYSFIIKAFIVGILISLCASLIGVSLVLRRNSMIGDGLSHVGFGAFAIASVLNFTPIYFALPIVILSSFLILRLNENSKLHGDSLIALLSSSSLAIGTFTVSITGVNTDINNYLFGSILSISNIDIIISIILSIFVISLYIFSYNKIFAITFDEKFAKSIGINTNLYNILFAVLCSIVVVLGMRLMGSLLISSLIIFPTLTSMMIYKKFKSVVISSIIISTISFIIGLISSYILNTPTGSTIVIINLLVFIIFKIVSNIKSIK